MQPAIDSAMCLYEPSTNKMHNGSYGREKDSKDLAI